MNEAIASKLILAFSPMNQFAINRDERFKTLPKAPIVEAVISIRASSAERPNEDTLRNLVQNRFGTKYQFAGSQREIQIQQQLTVALNQPEPPKQTVRDLGWMGLRFQSKDQKYIAQFNRDGFALSRLEPYENWENFSTEALRLWGGYEEFAKPLQIDRLGLRYINRIQLPPNESRFEDYLKIAAPTTESLSFPISGFMHQDSVFVPNYPYAINIIKTIQPPNPSVGNGLNLILDIDTFTTVTFDLHRSKLRNHLTEMRWLKNKIFFDIVTEKSLEIFE